MKLRDLFVTLGLDVDEATFAAGLTAVEGIKLGLHAIVAAAESAIAASTLVVAICKSATAWAAFSLVDTTLAPVEAAAAA